MNKQQKFAAIEKRQLSIMLKQQFGYYLVLLGHDNLDIVKTCQIRQHILVDETTNITTPKNSDDKVQASWYHLPFPPQSIDLIVLHHVLEFAASPHAILKEVQRILRPDGKIIISAYNPWRPFGYRLWRQRRKSHPDKRHAHMVSPLELKYFLKQTSFEVLKTTYYGVALSQHNGKKNNPLFDRLILSVMPFLSGAYMIEAINRTKLLTSLPNCWQPYKMVNKKRVAATPCKQPKLKVLENTES